MTKISICKIKTKDELAVCQEIRKEVFVLGQNVPLHEERDGLDEHAEHYLLSANQKPAATARIRFIDTVAKIERVAVLDGHQGTGLGRSLMNHIIDELRTRPKILKAMLGSQTHAIPFYAKLGFVPYGEEYMDANIPHRNMSINTKQ